MIRSFFKFILFNLANISSLLLLFFLFARIILLNYHYYPYSLNKYDVYKKLSVLITSQAQKYLILQALSEEELNALKTEQKEALNKQVSASTSFINEENTKDFLNTNVKYILKYLNRDSTDLTFYLPVNNWGLTNTALSQIPDYLKTGDINIATILEKQNVNNPNIISVISQLKNTALYVDICLLLSFFGFVFCSFLHTLADNHKEKIQSYGKLIASIGVITLILSWLFYIGTERLFLTSITSLSFEQKLLSILFPVFSRPLVYIFSFFGLIQLIFGIILFNKKSNNELVTKGKVR